MDLNDHSNVGIPAVDHTEMAIASTVLEGGNGRLNGHSFGLQSCCMPCRRCGPAISRCACRPTGPASEGKIADTFNEIVAANERMADQLEHVGQVVGREGKTRTRVKFGLSSGAWGEMESSVNMLIDDLLWPTTEVTARHQRGGARAICCRPCGSTWMAARWKGEFLRARPALSTR